MVLCCDPVASRDGRNFGAAINRYLKPHLDRSTFESCRAQASEEWPIGAIFNSS
jgi:hypothetical protein